MPIRFRCAYCNQLLGIARRKAGTVVRCPTCAGQVVVPNTETEEPEQLPGEQEQLVFERSDFDALLSRDEPTAVPGERKPKPITSGDEVVALSSPEPAKPGGEWSLVPEPAYGVGQAPAPLAQPVSAAAVDGIFMSRARATLLLVVAVIAIAAAFAGGILVGKYLLSQRTVGVSRLVTEAGWEGGRIPNSGKFTTGTSVNRKVDLALA
jgi:phage FluMu protein Com